MPCKWTCSFRLPVLSVLSLFIALYYSLADDTNLNEINKKITEDIMDNRRCPLSLDMA